MKAKREQEELVKVGFRIPLRLKKAMEYTAVNERRSINDQAIVLLEKALNQTVVMTGTGQAEHTREQEAL